MRITRVPSLVFLLLPLELLATSIGNAYANLPLSFERLGSGVAERFVAQGTRSG